MNEIICAELGELSVRVAEQQLAFGVQRDGRQIDFVLGLEERVALWQLKDGRWSEWTRDAKQRKNRFGFLVQTLIEGHVAAVRAVVWIAR